MRLPTIAAALLAVAAQSPDGAAGQLKPGTVEVQVVDDRHEHPALDQVAAAAVNDALTDADFLVLPGEGHSRYIARVTATQEGRGAVAADTRSGGGVNVAGGRLGVSLPSSNKELAGLVVTRLEVSLVLRDSGQTVWRGSASTAQVQSTAAGASAAVATKLASAVIRRFPETMEGPIAVP